MSKKLPISIGILSWNSPQILNNTLNSYKSLGLFNIVSEANIAFQEISKEDIGLAKSFSLSYIGYDKNVGIGNAFIDLAKKSTQPYFITLEHDWELIENEDVTFNRLNLGIKLLKTGISAVRYRHRKNPGDPLYSKNVYENNELNHYEPITQLYSPHLLDCIHWKESPEIDFPDKIQKINSYFIASSRWANFTNNPCMYETKFYIDTVSQFTNDDLHLEPAISYWWVRQNFKIAHGEGLFKHNDFIKF